MKGKISSVLIYIVLSTAYFSCREKYAVVVVQAVDHDTRSDKVRMDVFNGFNNQFLGNTPSLIITLASYHPRRDAVINFVVKSNDYSSTMFMGKVTKWCSNYNTAHYAWNWNTFAIEVNKKSP